MDEFAVVCGHFPPTKWLMVPFSSRIGAMQALSQNSSPSFLLLQNSPCHVLPPVMVSQRWRYSWAEVLPVLRTRGLRPDNSAIV